MKILSLEHEHFSKNAIAELQKYAEIVPFDPWDGKEELNQWHSRHTFNYYDQFNGILTKIGFPIGELMIDQMRYLEWIGTPTTGLTHINLDYCKQRCIRVLSLKGETGFLKDIWATAEHTLALIFAITRKIVACQPEGKSRYDFVGTQLRGKTLGIVGYGRVGKQVESLGRGIGLEIITADIEDGNYYRNLDTVLYNSDIVSLHADYRQENKRMVNREWFKKMRNGAFFINTSRGEMVNEDDLIDALRADKLAGVALDVVWNEHFGHRNKTLELMAYTYPEKLIITPHVAGCTKESMEITDMFLAKKIIQEVYR